VKTRKCLSATMHASALSIAKGSVLQKLLDVFTNKLLHGLFKKLMPPITTLYFLFFQGLECSVCVLLTTTFFVG